MPEYRVIDDSIQDQFGKLRAKTQIFGGGYGNGKTAAAVVQKALKIAREYPGANILIARSTYPKLNDTIRKEFLKWCPQNWIKSFPLSKNAENTCTLKNGTTINFRYIQQQGKAASEGQQTTSNLLSATYDLIIVDQLEDPEITEKDFDDLKGRLRGNARYIGDDPTMPVTGPRWFIGCVNPTRNWVFRRLIAPLKKYQQHGIIDPLLLCDRHTRDNPDGTPNPLADQPILDADGKPRITIELVEGSTYTNRHNLGEDFIQDLENTYRGQSRDRFLYGEWAAYEGLVHPEFSEITHCITQQEMYDYFASNVDIGIEPSWIEGYDFGMIVPSCYLLAFNDRRGNVFICDGFYQPEDALHIDKQQEVITEIRKEWGVDPDNNIWADPAVFKRSPKRTGGAKNVAQMFNEGDHAVRMVRAENTIESGLVKVNAYLSIKPHHRHPITRQMGAPHIFVASELTYVISEFTSYYWKVNPQGQRIDEPIDSNDHAMNTIKYMLSKQPDLAQRTPRKPTTRHLHVWSEARDEHEDA